MFSRSRHLIFSVTTIANQVIGYFFVRLLAQRYGTSPEKASFDIAYSVPFVIMSLTGLFFMQGVLTAHFASRDEEQRSKDVSTLVVLLLAFCSLGALCSIGFRAELAAVLAPGFSEVEQAHIANLIIAFFPLLFAYSIFTVFSAALIAARIPLEADVCSLFSRAPVLVALIILPYSVSLTAIAWGLSASSFLAVFAGLYVLHKKAAFRFTLPGKILSDELRKLIVRSIGFVLAAVLAQLAFAVMRAALSLDSTTAVASYGYAMMILAPLSLLLGKPIAYAFGPQFLAASEASSTGRRKELRKILSWTLLVTSIATVACFFLSDQIISILFLGGVFDQQSLRLTSSILRLLCLALPALVLMWVLFFPLLGKGSQVSAQLVYSLGSGLHLIGCVIGYLFGGVPGVCLGYVVAMYVQLALAMRSVGWQGRQATSA